MSKSGLFLGGVPTDPDVKRLIEAFPSLKPGDEISHNDVANVLGVERASGRYRTVTTAWRNHLVKSCNIRLRAINGVGYRVMEAMERVTHNVRGLGKGTKIIRRASDDVRRVDATQLSQEQQRVTEHVLRRMDSVTDFLLKTSKEIAIEFKPITQLPRVRPEGK